ncbi:MAG: hypothetical protein JWM11_7162, partial [Planctomycetaceae bacterium]|nr:hypothetical protein [Planctomycetaceae bacterium]
MSTESELPEGSRPTEDSQWQDDTGDDIELARQLERFHEQPYGDLEHSDGDAAASFDLERLNRLQRAKDCVRLLDRAAFAENRQSGAPDRQRRFTTREVTWDDFAGS